MHCLCTILEPYMQKDTGQVLLVHETDHEAIAYFTFDASAGRDRFACACW